MALYEWRVYGERWQGGPLFTRQDAINEACRRLAKGRVYQTCENGRYPESVRIHCVGGWAEELGLQA
jgi:hypothetical protein